MKYTERSLNIYVIRVPERQERNCHRNNFEEIVANNFPKLRRTTTRRFKDLIICKARQRKRKVHLNTLY